MWDGGSVGEAVVSSTSRGCVLWVSFVDEGVVGRIQRVCGCVGTTIDRP